MSKPILRLTGIDDNAFSILGAAKRVARKNDMDWETIQTSAMSGDYDHLLQVMMEHFEVI